MSRPLRAAVSRLALRHNAAVARARAPDAKLMIVLKANAYGHGLLRVAEALADADAIAVLDVEDGVRVRRSGFERRVLLLEGFFEPGELTLISEQRLTAVVHCPEQLAILESAAVPNPIELFLKINTGMNRLGLRPALLGQALERLRSVRAAGDVTLMTHFACADDAQGIEEQLAVFERATAGLPLPVSLANSATLLRYPQAARGWVRPGIMLYGASPFAEQAAANLNLRPAMTLESRLIAVHNVAAGESIGYGATFRAPAPLRIGVVACGYADGYPRHAGTGTPVLVRGQRTRTLGRVSMDMLCVDLTGISGAEVGATVVLWGEGLPVEEVATAAGTISYELLCGVAPRVPVLDVP